MTGVLYAEYRDEAALRTAVDALRARGHRLEVYSPYPLHDIDQLLGARPSRIAPVALSAGVVGASAAYGLQWLLNAYLYPLNVGGRPPHMPLSFVPITFEMGVLAAAITAIAAVLVRGRLVRLYDPVFDVDGFESASADRFWIRIAPAAAGARDDVDATAPVRVAEKEAS